MRIAIVHDYIKEYGGAERVLEALTEIYPDAPIYTSVYLPSFLGPHKKRFKKLRIKTSWAQLFPFRAKLISPIRLIAPLLFTSFDFSKFDVIIVSATGAYFPNSLNKKNAVQISYTHTPPRYLYGYETARNWKKNKVYFALGTLAIHFLRLWDFKYSKNVDFYIANSKETAARIKKFYRKDSKVIYPPVDLPKTVLNSAKREYFLAGGRIARAKHTDLIIDAFVKNGLPLKIFGKAFSGFENEIKAKIKNNSNIEFLGEVTDGEKAKLMKGAKAFVFASEDEDFGITPVEAMACGTPVISHRSGGVLETVIDGKTGIFYDELTLDSLLNAILKFQKLKLKPEDCITQAQKFSKERFKKEIKEFVDSKVR
ncbi:MAG: glycosyltransferase [Patescibacteria group bacterium]|nr:glycosyltransferase [Patescibacteria group bacterium]